MIVPLSSSLHPSVRTNFHRLAVSQPAAILHIPVWRSYTVRVVRSLMCVVGLMLAAPDAATGQSLELFGSAGPTITDDGNSFAVGAGFSPHSRLTLVFSFERTHLESRTRQFPGGSSSFRGGTLYLGAAELRVVPFGRGRFGPYGLAGLATGVSYPNVNDRFPNPVTNHVAAMSLGGGIHAPIDERFTVFADVRMTVGAEGNDGMVGVAPARVGVSWRF